MKSTALITVALVACSLGSCRRSPSTNAKTRNNQAGVMKAAPKLAQLRSWPKSSDHIPGAAQIAAVVTPDAIVVQGKTVVSLTRFEVAAKDLEGKAPALIVPLKTALESLAGKRRKMVKSALWLVLNLDPSTPFQLLAEVLTTAATAGVRNIGFPVRTAAGTGLLYTRLAGRARKPQPDVKKRPLSITLAVTRSSYRVLVEGQLEDSGKVIPLTRCYLDETTGNPVLSSNNNAKLNTHCYDRPRLYRYLAGWKKKFPTDETIHISAQSDIKWRDIAPAIATASYLRAANKGSSTPVYQFASYDGFLN
ncbi:MAG: hypothetical protein KC609_12645 [Myxococcales bacterium]|nr:hypothetical protein [Myxococcales bacterium]